MARTGRFGRLPTAAPDLSSQIVSLMEQWMNAEDRNILDAWTNGGKYKGKKVTDQQLLKHYRQRRNGYDRDDPEWDEWNQDLWQLRYQIADEKVQMAYRMGKIGPQAVAAHYRKWARKMPKNSSYYRNLMATAGDFAKAAAAGRSSAAKGFDYQAMQNRINALEREEKQYTDFFGALTKYAVDRGYIQEGESLMDPDVLNIFEADDLGAILDGVREEMLTKSQFREFRQGARIDFASWDGQRFTDRGVRESVNEFVRIQRQKIREWRKAPYDMSSYIKGARDAIRDARSYSRLVKQKGGYFDTASDLAEAWDIYTDGVQGALDPEDVFSGDKNMRQALVKARSNYRKLGDSDTVAALDAAIKGFDAGEADIEALLQLDPQVTTGLFGAYSPWASEGGAAEWAQNRAALKNIIPLIKTGDAAIEYNEQPSEAELAAGAAAQPPFVGYTLETNASGRTVATNPVTGEQKVLGDKVQIVNVGSSSGGLTTALVTGKEVYDPEGNLAGYRFDVQGRTQWGEYDANGRLKVGPVNPWEQTSGTQLDDRGPEGIHVVTVGQPPEGEQEPVFEPVEVTLQRAIENIENTAGLTEEERKSKREGIAAVQDKVEDGDWTNADFDDPMVLDAFEAAFPEIVGYWQNYESEPGAARKAIAKEYARQRFDADIEYTEQDAAYVTSTGALRDPGAAISYAQGEYADLLPEEVAARQNIVANAPEGQPYRQTVAQAQEEQPYQPGMQTLDIGYGGASVAGYGDPDEEVYFPSDAIDEGVPGSVDGIAASQIYGTYDNLNLAFAMSDPNLKQLTKSQTDLFIKTSARNFTPGREEEQAATFNQQLSTVITYGDLDPSVALAIQNGGSITATMAGQAQGIGLGYADAEVAGAERIEGLFPGWEVQLSETASGVAPETKPRRTSVAVDSMHEKRADQIFLDIREPVAETKTQPTIKLAANLVDPAAKAEAQKVNINAPQVPGPYGVPTPAGYRVSVQAPAPVSVSTPSASVSAPTAPGVPGSKTLGPPTPTSPKLDITKPMVR